MDFKRIRIESLKWLLPVLFIIYYSCVSAFIHVHVNNGTTIVHSHPYKKASDGSAHQHDSLSEIQLFHILSSVNVTDGAVYSLQLDLYVQPFIYLVEKTVYPTYLTPVLGALSLRAPPSLSKI